MQMGSGRVGLYSFGGLDDGNARSSHIIHPDLQNLNVGDRVLPICGVASIEEESTMLWLFDQRAGPWGGAIWCWGLYPTADGHTRLVSRLRQDYRFDSIPSTIAWIFMDPLEIVMMRTTMLGIRKRVENYQPGALDDQSIDSTQVAEGGEQ